MLRFHRFFGAFSLFFVYKEQDVSLPFLNYYSRYSHSMSKFRNNTFRVVTILMMLSTASLGVSYSHAESEENLEFEEIQQDSTKVPYSDEIRTILTERVVDGELEVMELVLPKDTTDKDLKRILSLEDTSGWSYIKHKSYQSGIVLFDGKVSKPLLDPYLWLGILSSNFLK